MDSNYIEIFIIIIVIGLIFVCLRTGKNIKEEFIFNNNNYKVKPVNSPLGVQFNIDKQCNETLSKSLGWKCWWRGNQNNWLVPNDTYSNYLENNPLKYDGVFKL